MFATDRTALRKVFIEAWKRYRNSEPLEPLHRQIAEVINEHPEYHSTLEAPEDALEKEFNDLHGQQNPFLHLGMHLAIRDQLAMDQPKGVRDCFQSLCQGPGGSHQAEHRMMEVLADALGEAQRSGAVPDEKRYLRRLAEISRVSLQM